MPKAEIFKTLFVGEDRPKTEASTKKTYVYLFVNLFCGSCEFVTDIYLQLSSFLYGFAYFRLYTRPMQGHRL